MKIRPLILVFFILIGCVKKPTETSALGSVTGTLFDASNNEKLAGAIVSIPNVGNRTTDNNGLYSFTDLEENVYTLSAAKSGYVTETAQVEIEGNKNKLLNFTLHTAQPAQLATTPNSLNFGQMESDLIISVNNLGDEELSWQISSDQSWLSLFPTTGTTINETDEISASVNRAGLEVGNYTANISLTSNGGSYNIPVLMEVTPVVLIIEPSSLDFGSELNQLSFNISNMGFGELNWSITSNEAWIDVTPLSGSLTNSSEDITVSVDRTGLEPDTYTSNILVHSNGGNHTVEITMSVPDGPTPLLEVSTTNLDFGAQEEQLTFNIINSGEAPLNWNLSDNQEWLFYYPPSGSTNPNETTTINVSVDRTGLSSGAYNGEISVTSNGGNKNVSISMFVPFLDTFENLNNWSTLGWELDTTNWMGWDSPTVVCTEITGENYLKTEINVIAGQTLSFRLKVWAQNDDNTSVKLYFNNVMVQEWFSDASATDWTFEYNPEIPFTTSGSINIKFVGHSEDYPQTQMMMIDNFRIE